MEPKTIPLLIVGGESDPNTQRVVDQAHLRGIEYHFWDTDRPTAKQIAWDFSSPVIDLGDHSFRPAAMFLRYNVFDGEPACNHAVHDAAESFALAWPEIRMLNRGTLGGGNNKSQNLVRARNCGFEIPQSTVLAELSPLKTIPNADAKIIKPLSGGDHAAIVSTINHNDAYLEQLVPQFVQERLEGENLRVFSIGESLFAFHLQTDHVDYRTDDSVRVDSVPVPDSLIEPTRRLVQMIGFDYCALDFRFRQGFESPVFLEVNSFPMFVAFDDASENRLADAILQFLTD